MNARNLLVGLATVSLGVFTPLSASTHPHVFAEARLDVIVDEQNQVETMRHVWRFDELFTSTVILEFDEDSDLKLNDSELKTVAQTIKISTADFNYFQSVLDNGKDVDVDLPGEIGISIEDEQMLLVFETRPKKPLLMSGTISFGVYDPTFYTAIDFLDDAHLTIKGQGDTCQTGVVRPDPDEVIAQNQSTLTDAFFNEPEGNDLSQIFATRLEVKC